LGKPRLDPGEGQQAFAPELLFAVSLTPGGSQEELGLLFSKSPEPAGKLGNRPWRRDCEPASARVTDHWRIPPIAVHSRALGAADHSLRRRPICRRGSARRQIDQRDPSMSQGLQTMPAPRPTNPKPQSGPPPLCGNVDLGENNESKPRRPRRSMRARIKARLSPRPCVHRLVGATYLDRGHRGL